MTHHDAAPHATIAASGRARAVATVGRIALLLTFAASSLRPAVARAAPAAAAPDMATVDFGFRTGQAQYNRGDHLAAARTWKGAAELMPEAVAYKQNRAGIYAYIAEAYEKAVAGGAGDEVVREAADVLDAYVERFAATYPGEAAAEPVTRALAGFQAEVAELDAAAKAVEPAPPAPAPEPAPPPPPAKWRGLAAGGGALVGGGVAMLAVAGVGVARGNSLERQIEDPANRCFAGSLAGTCADLDRKGAAANGMFVAGLVAAPLLLGAGITMLVLAARRKAPSRQALAPIVGPGMTGLVWQGRF